MLFYLFSTFKFKSRFHSSFIHLIPDHEGDIEECVHLCVGPDEGLAEVPRHLVLALELVPHRVQQRRGGPHVPDRPPRAAAVRLRDLTNQS